MNRMRETTVANYNTTRTNHENNLDALLDDLQSTVSRSNVNRNLNGNVTGYRETRRTVSDGTPAGTVSEYHIEYLNPANTTTHVTESTFHSPSKIDYNNQSSTTNYKYNTSQSYVDSSSNVKDGKFKQNIYELDSLLDDLHNQKNSYGERNQQITTYRNQSGIDSGLLESNRSNTPRSSRRLIEEQNYREDRSLRERSLSPNAKRELVFTGSRSRDPSPSTITYNATATTHPAPLRKEYYRYEKTTSTRTTAPTITDYPNYDGSRPHTPTDRYYYPAIEDSSPKQILPPPAVPQSPNSYHYSSVVTQDNRPPSPHPSDNLIERVEEVTSYSDPPKTVPGGNKTTHYYYSNTRETRETRPDLSRSITPHRSPSPVSFQHPLPPSNKTMITTYENNTNYRPSSPTLHQKFSSSDPSNQSPPTHTVSMHKYTTTTNKYVDDSTNIRPRPFPNPSPVQEEQQPPKKLDELMASFSDTEINEYHSHRENHVQHDSSYRNGILKKPEIIDDKKTPPAPPIRLAEQTKELEQKKESRNLSGPPVFYPPGELFKKKEESMMQQQSSGGGRYKAKGKYEYKASSKSKQSESSGKTVVPVCLPLCCAMPCSIM